MCVLRHCDVIATSRARHMSLGKRAVRSRDAYCGCLFDWQSVAYCLARSCARFERPSFTTNDNLKRKGFHRPV
jgi:hypothetical protein